MHLRRLLTTTAVATAATLALTGSTEAASVSLSDDDSASALAAMRRDPVPIGSSTLAHVLDDGCTAQRKKKRLRWNGGLPVGVSPKRWPSGRVVLCWTKYRIQDRNPDADYYVARLTSHWTVRGWGDPSYPAAMSQIVTSSRKATNNVYGASPGKKSDSDCTESISIGFSAGPFSISTSPKICDEYGYSRHRFGKKQAYWRSSQAGGLRVVDTAFAQKVPQGVVPTFDYYFAVPRYRNVWYEAGGYWKSTKAHKWVTFSNK